MKKRTASVKGVAAALIAAMLVFGGCPNPADNTNSGGEPDIAVLFTSLEADGSATKTTEKLILTFDRDITGLSAGDIYLTAGSTGAVKGSLTGKGGGVYELGVDGVNADGTVSVTVTKPGYTISGGERHATVYYAPETSFVAVTGINGVPTAATVGTGLALTGVVTPENATNQAIIWAVNSAETSGAVIDNGILNTTAAGTVIVTATISNGEAAGTDYVQDFTITVESLFVAVTGISGVPTAATAGTGLALTGTVAPENATNQTIVWAVNSAGSTGAVIINDSILNTGAAGTVIVTATISNGAAAGTDYVQDFTITIESLFVAVTGISGVPTTATAGIGLSLAGTVVPNNATNQTIVWTMKNAGTSGAVIINDGILNTIAAGAVIVTATINGGAAAGVDYVRDFAITVNPFVPVTSISGVPAAGTVGTGITLTGGVVPNNATNQAIAWTVDSKGTTGAVINNGILNTTDAGTVVVTATISNGAALGVDYTQDFDITVIVPVTNITGVPAGAIAGTVFALTGAAVPDNATNQAIVWAIKSAGTTSASMNDGILNTPAAGTVVVTATISSGTAVGADYTQDFNIIVIVPVTDITGVPDTTTAGTGLTLTGAVVPDNATNQTIVWTIKSAGTTGAAINGNILDTTAAGTLTVTATIADGTEVGTDYTQDFNITVLIGGTGLIITFDQLADEDITIPDIDIYKINGTKTAIISLSDAEGYANIQWYVDGEAKSGATTETFTLNAASYLLGRHWISVELTRDGIPYSKTVSFNVHY
jgi:endo-1,4-beta-xylanase